MFTFLHSPPLVPAELGQEIDQDRLAFDPWQHEYRGFVSRTVHIERDVEGRDRLLARMNVDREPFRTSKSRGEATPTAVCAVHSPSGGRSLVGMLITTRTRPSACAITALPFSAAYAIAAGALAG
ncbi:MAG TPA: hypothetical protein VM734_00755 [Kofleriaceae bacterium]|nr:hypothetical protein [Kofleriaceae bacterium]